MGVTKERTRGQGRVADRRTDGGTDEGVGRWRVRATGVLGAPLGSASRASRWGERIPRCPLWHLLLLCGRLRQHLPRPGSRLVWKLHVFPVERGLPAGSEPRDATQGLAPSGARRCPETITIIVTYFLSFHNMAWLCTEQAPIHSFLHSTCWAWF